MLTGQPTPFDPNRKSRPNNNNIWNGRYYGRLRGAGAAWSRLNNFHKFNLLDQLLEKKENGTITEDESKRIDELLYPERKGFFRFLSKIF